jgi:hypothetical protein
MIRDMPTDPPHLHALEYPALREEILFLVRQSYVTENYVAIATAALYAWSAGNRGSEIASVAWWVPVLFGVLGGVREIGLRNRIAQIGNYLRTVEADLRQADHQGWEHCLHGLRQKRFGKILGFTSGLFWGVYLVATLLVAVIMTQG